MEKNKKGDEKKSAKDKKRMLITLVVLGSVIGTTIALLIRYNPPNIGGSIGNLGDTSRIKIAAVTYNGIDISNISTVSIWSIGMNEDEYNFNLYDFILSDSADKINILYDSNKKYFATIIPTDTDYFGRHRQIAGGINKITMFTKPDDVQSSLFDRNNISDTGKRNGTLTMFTRIIGDFSGLPTDKNFETQDIDALMYNFTFDGIITSMDVLNITGVDTIIQTEKLNGTNSIIVAIITPMDITNFLLADVDVSYGLNITSVQVMYKETIYQTIL